MLCEWLTTDFLKKCKSCSLCALILCYDGIVEEPTGNHSFFFPIEKAPTEMAGAFSLSKKVTEKWPFSRIGDENAV